MIGSPGFAQAAGFVLGGVVGYTIGSGLTHGQDSRRAMYSGLSIDQILLADRSNFQIPLGSIIRGKFNAGINMVTTPRLILWIPGNELTFKFMNSFWFKNKAEVQFTKDLLSRLLPGRLVFEGI